MTMINFFFFKKKKKHELQCFASISHVEVKYYTSTIKLNTFVK